MHKLSDQGSERSTANWAYQVLLCRSEVFRQFSKTKMASLLLRLTVLTIIVGVVLSTADVEREERGFKSFFKRIGKGIKKAAVAVGKGTKKAAIVVGKGTKKAAIAVAKGTKKAVVAVGKGTKKAAVAVGKGVKKAAVAVGKGVKRVIQKIRIATIKWMFPYITYKVADNEDEEAEIILLKTESTINKGLGLVNEGARLMAKADDLEVSLGNEVHKRGLGDSIANGFKDFIKAIRGVAQRAIKAGKKVISNSDRIKAAFTDAAIDISHVISDGVADVGSAISDIGDSISDAGKKLQQAKTSGDNVSDNFGDAIDELENAGRLAIEAGKEFEEVGRRSLSLGQRLLKLGKDLVKVMYGPSVQVKSVTEIMAARRVRRHQTLPYAAIRLQINRLAPLDSMMQQ
ncbi:hypothetical protein ElyMa_005136800 [Elysia marginata]|uniref:Uncharacterized protein n=1 Tax=Elysia marginata TaxID=1093978 RepID=A0AAV4JSN0_9GAST|nr:hypothetical protein ElyMa_005136800 [Elysia marginata]